MYCDSLEGDVGEQRDSREDGGDAAAHVGDEGQNLVVLRIYVRWSSWYVLNREMQTNVERGPLLLKEKRRRTCTFVCQIHFKNMHIVLQFE